MSAPEITGRDGVRLATYAEGPEGAPALLFIHGWAQQSVCWRPVMDRLKDRFRVVAMDLRGHGASDKPEGEGPYTDTALWADDVTAVIEGYGLEKPVLVGWSYGSRVIASYLSVHGDGALGGVVLAGGILTIGAAREDWMVGPSSPGVQRDLYTGDLPRRLAATAKFVRECTAQPLDTQAYGELVGANMLCPPHVRRALFAPTWDFRPVYAAMTCPGLVIHGVQDEVVSAATGEAAAKLMQDARYLPYDGTGHAPFLENPDRFAADVADFTETRARRKEAV
ncbi:alpha/beta hydrolase [Roseovarius sp.]|uniref:alpha/beta fold hydrolase n=1 Tax=Roseovarius sp. TaxID=1486281 RepID=UPI0026356257|nr:alpha/beta hydrolase [Roseovarius sp.]MDM8164850.1 alpha/beta hydrolase [Roseovarius sp.]